MFGLLQEPESQEHFVAKLNGMDKVLLVLSNYKKKDPETLQEEEFVQNLFNSLCISLQTPSSQLHFQQLQGMELMLLMVKYVIIRHHSSHIL